MTDDESMEEEAVNRDDYQRICDRIARKAIRYAKGMAAEDDADLDLDETREHLSLIHI